MKLLGWLLVIAILFIVASNWYIQDSTKSYIYSGVGEVPVAQAALVPGAAVYQSGALSPILEARTEAARALYGAHKITVILVSGDNSTLSHNEVNPVKKYLVAHGIPEDDIVLDHAGFDTYSSLYRARDIFGATSLIITTQRFHLPRALFIAHALGIPAYGLVADAGAVSTNNYMREIGANVKAVIDVVFDRKPKYLGNPIPLDAR